jgi:hypothetical protein
MCRKVTSISSWIYGASVGCINHLEFVPTRRTLIGKDKFIEVEETWKGSMRDLKVWGIISKFCKSFLRARRALATW